MKDDLKKIAAGWRWFRPPPRPRHAPAPPQKTEGAFETAWARRRWANRVRAYFQEGLMLPAYRYVASPTVRGRDRLRHLKQPVVIAANHVSHLDTAAILEALPPAFRDRTLVGGAADYFFTTRLRGSIAALAIGAFPVERKRASAASARLSVKIVNEGWNVILFPEGGRSPDGWLQELKPGAAFIAAKTGRPLVPMWISGTEKILPKGAKKIRRGQVDVLIGDPLYPAEGEDARKLHARFEVALKRLGTEATTDWWRSLRSEDAELFGPGAARWRRIWARGEALDDSNDDRGSRWR